MSLIFQQKVKLLYSHLFVFNRILINSRKHYATDDFYGLITHGSSKDVKSTEGHNYLQKKLNKLAPRELIPGDTIKSSNTLTLPYGFIRYDNQERVNVADKNKSKTPKDSAKRGPIISEGKDNHIDDEGLCTKTHISHNSKNSNENSDMNFIDEHFFYYDKPFTEKGQLSSVESYILENKDTFNQKDLSYIDSQYFQNNSTTSAEVLVEDCDSGIKECSQSMSETYVAQQRNDEFVYDNEHNENNVQYHSNDLDLSFIDEQYFEPTLNRRNETSGIAERKPKDAFKKQFLSTNDDKTGITESLFEEAKDFRQVNSVKNKNLREKSVSYKGKAYSVIQELREQKQSLSLEESQITYDSQGYRILKNQVPQFNHASSLDITRLIRKKILYEGNDIVAINKPYGLSSHGGPGVKHSVGQLLDAILPSCKLHLVHRLDKETTGVMLLAKTVDKANQLQQMFQKKEVKKRYLAITKGYPSSPKGLIDIPIAQGKVGDRYRMTLRPYRTPELNPVLPHSQEGSSAKTLYRVLDSKNMTSLIECIAITGLKHQIRVHLALGLNCPILGDHKYAHLNEISPMQLHPETLHRLKIRQSKVRYVPMHLHARSLMLPHLLDGKHLFISAPLPYFFIGNMRSLKLTLPPKC